MDLTAKRRVLPTFNPQLENPFKKSKRKKKTKRKVPYPVNTMEKFFTRMRRVLSNMENEETLFLNSLANTFSTPQGGRNQNTVERILTADDVIKHYYDNYVQERIEKSYLPPTLVDGFVNKVYEYIEDNGTEDEIRVVQKLKSQHGFMGNTLSTVFNSAFAFVLDQNKERILKPEKQHDQIRINKAVDAYVRMKTDVPKLKEALNLYSKGRLFAAGVSDLVWQALIGGISLLQVYDTYKYLEDDSPIASGSWGSLEFSPEMKIAQSVALFLPVLDFANDSRAWTRNRILNTPDEEYTKARAKTSLIKTLNYSWLGSSLWALNIGTGISSPGTFTLSLGNLARPLIKAGATGVAEGIRDFMVSTVPGAATFFGYFAQTPYEARDDGTKTFTEGNSTTSTDDVREDFYGAYGDEEALKYLFRITSGDLTATTTQAIEYGNATSGTPPERVYSNEPMNVTFPSTGNTTAITANGVVIDLNQPTQVTLMDEIAVAQQIFRKIEDLQYKKHVQCKTYYNPVTQGHYRECADPLRQNQAQLQGHMVGLHPKHTEGLYNAVRQPWLESGLSSELFWQALHNHLGLEGQELLTTDENVVKYLNQDLIKGAVEFVDTNKKLLSNHEIDQTLIDVPTIIAAGHTHAYIQHRHDEISLHLAKFYDEDFMAKTDKVYNNLLSSWIKSGTKQTLAKIGNFYKNTREYFRLPDLIDTPTRETLGLPDPTKESSISTFSNSSIYGDETFNDRNIVRANIEELQEVHNKYKGKNAIARLAFDNELSEAKAFGFGSEAFYNRYANAAAQTIGNSNADERSTIDFINDIMEEINTITNNREQRNSVRKQVIDKSLNALHNRLKNLEDSNFEKLFTENAPMFDHLKQHGSVFTKKVSNINSQFINHKNYNNQANPNRGITHEGNSDETPMDDDSANEKIKN